MMQLPEGELVIQIQHQQQLITIPGFPNGTHATKGRSKRRNGKAENRRKRKASRERGKATEASGTPGIPHRATHPADWRQHPILT